MTNDGNNTLVYDGENRVLSATNSSASGSYSYDGNNLRVQKVSGSTTTAYIFSGSKMITEYDNGAAPSSPSREYVYSSGALLAKIDSSGTKYYHQDHLSNRLVTDSSGNVLEQLGHFPFGESWYNTSSDKWLFTTYERDSETSNDYAMARSYVNRLGRFSSLDPLSGSRGNPQSLNLYAYVHNDPINSTDPTGRRAAPVYACEIGGNSIGPCNGNPFDGGSSTLSCPSNPCVIMGLEIFDAIAGVPGTYLYQDMYGNLGFGFSIDLWSGTLNEIDSVRAGIENPNSTFPPHQMTDPGDYPWTGFQVYVTDSGAGDVQISGVVPDYSNALAEANYWAAQAAPYQAACQMGSCSMPLSIQNAVEESLNQQAAAQEVLIGAILKNSPGSVP